MTSTDWNAWHDEYADPESHLAQRRRVVQRHIARWLDATAPEAVRVLSACAGDGSDVLGVLVSRTDAARVTVTLLERDTRLVDRARAHAARIGGAAVQVRRTDAGTTAAYTDAVPADLVLLCGIFGNICDADVRRTVEAAPALCAPGATVVWTRHRKEPDLTPRIRGWFAEQEFTEVEFVAPAHGVWSVGVARFGGETAPLPEDQRLFTFVR